MRRQARVYMVPPGQAWHYKPLLQLVGKTGLHRDTGNGVVLV